MEAAFRLEGMKAKKSFSFENNEKIHAIVDGILHERYMDGGKKGKPNRTAMAKDMGLSAVHLGLFLDGRKGAGPSLLEGIVKLTGYSLDYLFGLSEYKWPVTPDEMAVVHQRIEADDPCPNRTIMLSAMGRDFVPEAVEQLRQESPAEDKSVTLWFYRLEAIQRTLFAEAVEQRPHPVRMLKYSGPERK